MKTFLIALALVVLSLASLAEAQRRMPAYGGGYYGQFSPYAFYNPQALLPYGGRGYGYGYGYGPRMYYGPRSGIWIGFHSGSYRYGNEPLSRSSDRPGVRFRLNLVSSDDLYLVENAEVSVLKDKPGVRGNVKDFTENPLPLKPGTREVLVDLKDGRTIPLVVNVPKDGVTTIELRLNNPNRTAPTPARPTITRPAYAPTPTPAAQ